MTWIAAIITGLVAGAIYSTWWSVAAFAVGVGVFAGAVTASKGPEWQAMAESDEPHQRQQAEAFMEAERERHGSLPQFSRSQLFAFEFIYSGGACIVAGSLSYVIFG